MDFMKGLICALLFDLGLVIGGFLGWLLVHYVL